MIPEPEQPRILGIMESVWNILHGEAKGAPGVLGVWEGRMVDVYDRTGASRTYYSKAYDLLSEMGCIVIERRGRREVQTRIVLLTPPTPELYERHHGNVAYRLTHGQSDATMRLEQRVKNIEGRLSGIELKDILIDFEQRLRKLEESKQEDDSGSPSS